MPNGIIPAEALQATGMLEALFGDTLAAVYLYGSAVAGGLRPMSDVDVLAVVNQGLSERARKSLVDRLLPLSGKVGNAGGVRPLEVTVINRNDVVPWHYPPRKEFLYGEWLRGQLEQGWIPEPAEDSDLAIVLAQVRSTSVTLFGREAAEVLEPVPMADIRRAMKDCLPDLINWLKGDERNVILTFARMWVTAAEGRFLAKDAAAEWAIPRLPKEQAHLLDLAAKAYRGEYTDRWEELDAEVAELVGSMLRGLEACL